MTAAVLKKEKAAVKKETGNHAGKHTGLMALYHKELQIICAVSVS